MSSGDLTGFRFYHSNKYPVHVTVHKNIRLVAKIIKSDNCETEPN